MNEPIRLSERLSRDAPELTMPNVVQDQAKPEPTGLDMRIIEKANGSYAGISHGQEQAFSSAVDFAEWFLEYDKLRNGPAPWWQRIQIWNG